jgi:hypothetical protein
LHSSPANLEHAVAIRVERSSRIECRSVAFSSHRFARERNTLPAADAVRNGNNRMADDVPAHVVQKPRREYRFADRTTMRNGSAFDVGDVLGRTGAAPNASSLAGIGILGHSTIDIRAYTPT